MLLRLLDRGNWHTYRLPKASFSYDGAHGWNTEWPRIREIGTGDDYLATMHGTFWHFPATFSLQNSAGLAPRSNYFKVVGDFARWGDSVVLGCDDSAQREFLNARSFKSEQGASLVSKSNLWFVGPETLSTLGSALGSGGVWLGDDVATAESTHVLVGVMRGLGNSPRTLGLIAQNSENAKRPLYELGPRLEFAASSDRAVRGQVWQAGAPDPATLPAQIDGDSVLIEEDGQRWRLPINPAQAVHQAFGEAIRFTRVVCEVVTERDMLNVAGTFNELPARNAGGFAHVRPVASHPFRIHDFCS